MKRIAGLLVCLAITSGAHALPMSFDESAKGSRYLQNLARHNARLESADNHYAAPDLTKNGSLLEAFTALESALPDVATPPPALHDLHGIGHLLQLDSSLLNDLILKDKRPGGSFSDRMQPTNVPEPTTLALLGAGLLGLGLRRRRATRV